MTSRIQKWGNSQGVRLPKHILDSLNWEDNEAIVIITQNDRIVIERAERKEPLTIEKLFENYNGDYCPEEIEWGEPIGREIW